MIHSRVLIACVALLASCVASRAEADIRPAKGLVCETRAQMEAFVSLVKKDVSDTVALRDSATASGSCSRQRIFYDQLEEMSADVQVPRYGTVRIVRVRVVAVVTEKIVHNTHDSELVIHFLPVVPVDRYMLLRPEGREI